MMSIGKSEEEAASDYVDSGRMEALLLPKVTAIISGG